MKYYSEYKEHLEWARKLTTDVLGFAPPPSPATDSFRADLAGLLCTAYIAALECCIKAIFTSFSREIHAVLGNVAEYHFERLSSKIHIDTIRKVYAGQFGEFYRLKFQELLDNKESEFLTRSGRSLREAYNNLLTWRHAFAHEGKKLATLDDVVSVLSLCEMVIYTLDDCMSARPPTMDSEEGRLVDAQ